MRTRTLTLTLTHTHTLTLRPHPHPQPHPHPDPHSHPHPDPHSHPHPDVHPHPHPHPHACLRSTHAPMRSGEEAARLRRRRWRELGERGVGRGVCREGVGRSAWAKSGIGEGARGASA